MAANETIHLLNQAGLETVRGTAVAATRKIYADITPSFDRTPTFGRARTGTYNARRRVSYPRTRVSFSGVDAATFEDLPWYLQLAVKGGVTGVTDGELTPAYTYDFVPSLSTDDLKSMTLEYNHVGNGMETSQVMVNTWTLRGDPDNDQESEWMLDLGMIGRDVVTGNTFTAALPDRDVEPILARGTKVYIDDTPGGIGGTQLTGKLINWSITGNNQIHFKAFSEDELYMAPNKVGRGERFYDAQFTFEFDDHDELDNFLSPTAVPRYIRLAREGSEINDAPTNKSLAVDMAGYWSSWSRSDREGNLTAVFGLMAGFDTTLATDIEITVVNDLATLA